MDFGTSEKVVFTPISITLKANREKVFHILAKYLQQTELFESKFIMASKYSKDLFCLHT
jgi:hypothetical protein